MAGLLTIGLLAATSSLGLLPKADRLFAKPQEGLSPAAAAPAAEGNSAVAKYEQPSQAAVDQVAAVETGDDRTEWVTHEDNNPSAAPAVMSYLVRSGDTISELSGRYDITEEQLLALNPSIQAESLRAGDLIKVPDKPAERGEFRPHYVWPAVGPITTPFGEHGLSWIGGVHTGLDIGAGMGDLVWAANDGVIVDTGTNGRGRGYGTYILIYHYNGWSTLYAHLSQVYRSIGYSVRKGEPIGEVGMTGFADGPHLHFEVWHGEDKVDPIQFLP